jgi:hypothetical protein
MKFKGPAGTPVENRVTKQYYGRFDSNGIYETDDPVTILSLERAGYKTVEKKGKKAKSTLEDDMKANFEEWPDAELAEMATGAGVDVEGLTKKEIIEKLVN